MRKPWATVEKRLRAVLGADMAFAVYNPASKTRRAQVVALRDLVAEYRDPGTPVIVARAVGAPEEKVTVTTVAEGFHAPRARGLASTGIRAAGNP